MASRLQFGLALAVAFHAVYSASSPLSPSCLPSAPSVTDLKQNVTYRGLCRNGVESFLNIPYGQDTSGEKRFASPEPFVFSENITEYDASRDGPVCPQPRTPPLPFMTPPLDQSENCLTLKVARPSGIGANAKLPVMIFIYGGGLFDGNINDRFYNPDGMVLQSIEGGTPIIFVDMNYRVNIFGFAQSKALSAESSLNAGLKDQRLALEWVRDNIQYFGGDPDSITVFGQSSGALSVTLQILAYGGGKPLPFHSAIIESTALEPTLTSDLSLDAYNEVANLTGCDTHGDPQSSETLACMRALPVETLLNVTIAQRTDMASRNAGDTDIYFPTVDGDILPQAPSELTQGGHFPKIPVVIGWTENDATLITLPTIKTPSDTFNFIHTFWKQLTNDSITTILSLYPSSEFSPDPSSGHSAEFYRSAQIARDIVFTCPSFFFGGAMATKYSAESQNPEVYYYIQNQTVYTQFLADLGLPGLGVIHTSDLPYVFGNFTTVNVSGNDNPTASDWDLLKRQSRSWSLFANEGQLSSSGKVTLQGWESAYLQPAPNLKLDSMDARIFVIGGSDPGMSSLDGPSAKKAVASEKLKDRCNFLNSPEIIKQLQY